MQRFNVKDIQQMKETEEKILMLTAYDYTSALLADVAGIPIILVGDSLGMVVLGYDTTIPVTLEDTIHHTKAVVRGCRQAMVIADMPFMTFQIDPSEALRNAGHCLKEGGAQAVKLEGGEEMASTVRRIVTAGIPVLGHIGLTPQSVHTLGGYRVQGNGKAQALQLIRDAHALEGSGAFAIVLELIPSPLSHLITRQLSIPTIGIGAGPYCDGQVQVWHDILGLYTGFVPKHTRQFANLSVTINQALQRYISEVKEGTFPGEKESFTMNDALAEQLESSLVS